MPRIDISRLRKDHSMSQSELAQHLQITQSFLSAIENGKSPLPLEKEDRLLEIFNLQDFSNYLMGGNGEHDPSRKLSEMTDSDLFNQLLSRFHRQAHSREDEHHHHDHHERINILEEQLAALLMRNDRLMERNDSLAATNDSLREEVDTLRTEIYRLKSLLVSNHIPF